MDRVYTWKVNLHHDDARRYMECVRRSGEGASSHSRWLLCLPVHGVACLTHTKPHRPLISTAGAVYCSCRNAASKKRHCAATCHLVRSWCRTMKKKDASWRHSLTSVST